ncbi:MAG: hypothetical protein IJG15_06095 [Lachnospiraceae bacterium]|nr:hypothetical protein [Lachnospiraceae bacterium]
MTEGIFAFEIEEGTGARGHHYEAAGADGRQGACAVVTGLLQERRHLVVPPLLGGVPVGRIAPHALSGLAQLRTVSFPPSLRSVGSFALHNCPHLEEVSLHDGITDYYNGVLRQDVRLQRIRLVVSQNNYTVMRDILSDSDMKLEFLLQFPEGEAHLLFPGYDYAFAENTMARTIQFSISGSGMVYRECVRRKGISFREYDRLFPRVIPDDPHAAVQIAADRLLYPHDLAPVHAQAYEDYLRDNIGDVLLQFVNALAAEPDGTGAEETWRRLRLVADRGMITDEAADAALRLAAESGIPQLAGVILGGRETQASAGPAGMESKDDGVLSLDDW